MRLDVDDDDLAACVSCGLCLPHCPTYRVTGDEARSPRGRITTMRAVHLGEAPVDEAVERSLATCIQCRGCETACPSGVPFGRLIAGARATLAAEDGARVTPRWERVALRALGHHRALLAGSTALALAGRLGLPVERLGVPADLPLGRPPLRRTGTDVWLFTGCVMDAWQRDVHVAAIEVLTAAGLGVRPTPAGAGCCGALAVHAGLVGLARTQLAAVMRSLPDDAPVVVDAAGCGAQLKEAGTVLSTIDAGRFAERVQDVHEVLVGRLHQLPDGPPLPLRVAVQDPCHLRHVQRGHDAVRTVLAPFVAEVVELDDDGLCCGAGGAFALTEPELAVAVRDRKVAAIERAGADLVVSANPGCALHLAAAGVPVRHPVEVVAEALRLRQ